MAEQITPLRAYAPVEEQRLRANNARAQYDQFRGGQSRIEAVPTSEPKSEELLKIVYPDFDLRTIGLLGQISRHGACRGQGTAGFFLEEEDRKLKIKGQIDTCMRCTVRPECLTYAVRASEGRREGIWGGKRPSALRLLRTVFNSAKRDGASDDELDALIASYAYRPVPRKKAQASS